MNKGARHTKARGNQPQSERKLGNDRAKRRAERVIKPRSTRTFEDFFLCVNTWGEIDEWNEPAAGFWT
jgi:hypothetical protein